MCMRLVKINNKHDTVGTTNMKLESSNEDAPSQNVIRHT